MVYVWSLSPNACWVVFSLISPPATACESKQIIFLEVLGNGTVHLTEVAPVALVKDYYHPLLKHRMVLVLLHKDGELLDGGNYDPVVVITTILILILQLPLKH